MEVYWANLGTPIVEILLLVLRLLESSPRLLIPDLALRNQRCGKDEGWGRLSTRLHNVRVTRFGILWREPAKRQVG